MKKKSQRKRELEKECYNTIYIKHTIYVFKIKYNINVKSKYI